MFRALRKDVIPYHAIIAVQTPAITARMVSWDHMYRAVRIPKITPNARKRKPITSFQRA